MRGLVHHSLEDYDAAIADFEQVQRIDPAFGKIRLADAYCARGALDVKKNLYDGALADYEKARELGAPTDGCECDPYWGLAALYLDHKHDADKSWSIVHAAKRRGYIPPEFLAHLKQVSGRDS
jgi:tetratricopeptide (TPR) repeat protein